MDEIPTNPLQALHLWFYTKIIDKLDAILSGQSKEITQMAALDDAIVDLQAKVAAETSANASAVVLINGISARIDAAIAAATAAGATTAQLQSLADLSGTLNSETGTLAAAVAANTPAA